MGDLLAGTTIAFLATDGVEQVELTEPRRAVEREGSATHLIALRGGEIQGFEHLTAAGTFPVDRTVDVADEMDYDGLVLPGGVANPDEPRRRRLRPGLPRGGQAGRGDQPRAVDARRGGGAGGPDHHVLAEPAHRGRPACPAGGVGRRRRRSRRDGSGDPRSTGRGESP